MSNIQELAERPSVRLAAVYVSNRLHLPFNMLVGLVTEKPNGEVDTQFFPRNRAGLEKIHQAQPMPPALSSEAFDGEIPEHELKLIVANAERDARCVSLSFCSKPNYPESTPGNPQ